MRRRSFLAAAAGTTAPGIAGCGGLVGGESDREPVTVETIDAPGSEAGTVPVPAPGRVTFVELFATSCEICAAAMDALRAAHRAVPDDVQFLSVTSEPVGLSVSAEAVASWWATHDGAWPVGLDDGVALARRFDATSVPTAVVVAPDGERVWSRTGRVEASRIVRAIRSAREGDGS